MDLPSPAEQRRQLLELFQHEMPFGKMKGYKLINLPEWYLVWFQRQGWPKGKLGIQLQTVYEIKSNGLEQEIRGLVQGQPRT